MTNPNALYAHLKAANHAIDQSDSIPKEVYHGCSGLLLLQGSEGGMGVSVQGGKGVLIAHRNNKWSNPVAISWHSFGAGAVAGFADKDILVFLNPAGMKVSVVSSVLMQFAIRTHKIFSILKRLVEGKGQVKFNVDIGCAA